MVECKVMKLFFDARYTRTDFHDGISRYSAELGNAILKLNNDTTFLICDEQQKKWFPDSAQFLMIHPGTSIKEPFTAFILNKYKPDVVYSPMQTIGTFGRKYKSVLTIHDLIYYRHNKPPRFLPLSVRVGWRVYHYSYWPQRLILKGGDVITAISQATVEDMRRAKMTNKHIPIVYNAPQQFNTHPVHHKEIVKNIVYMGSFMPYKNAETLIKGMEFLPGRTLHLLSRINPDRKKELETLIPEGADVVFHDGVSDDTYEKLLSDNAILASASLDEGYGLPVAEALAMGVPAVITDMPIFHEVGGDGATFFDAHSPKKFAEAVKKLDNKTYRDEKITLGKTQITKFSWGKSARVLYEAVQGLF